MLIHTHVSIFPGEVNYASNAYSLTGRYLYGKYLSENLGNIYQKISLFKTLAPKDFQAPFLCNRCPRRKPSSREYFPCMAHKFDKICRPYIYNPVIFPREDNGTIYRALKEALWRPHIMKICLKSKEDNGIDEINGINLICMQLHLPIFYLYCGMQFFPCMSNLW